MRVMKSAPTSNTRSARPDSIWAAPRAMPERNEVQAAVMAPSGMDELHVGERALGQTGEDLARADLDEALDPADVQGEKRLAPAHGMRQGGDELLADVLEGLSGDRREHRHARLGDGCA